MMHVARIEGSYSYDFKTLYVNLQERDLRRPRFRWEDNVRMDLKETDVNTRNWIDSSQVGNYWRASEFH
jgi:hypothetical protein